MKTPVRWLPLTIKISSFNIQNQEISIVTNRDDLLLCHPLNLKDCLAKPGGFFWGFLLLEWGSCSTFHLPSWSFFSKAHVLDEHDAQCHPNHPWEGAERWIFHWQRIEKNGFQSDDKPLPKTNSSSHLQIGRNRAPKGSRNVSQLPPFFGANMLVSGRVIIPIGWVWGSFDMENPSDLEVNQEEVLHVPGPGFSSLLLNRY